MDKRWLYEHEDNNTVRYVLGYIREKPLFVFGINPSTAEPDNLDPTLKSVERIALANGYDSFVMFNVYPIRSTIFENLSKEENTYYRKQNEEKIAEVLKNYEGAIDVWLAFGDLVEKRTYLKECLKGIVENAFGSSNITYICAGITKKGNPRHPLYLKGTSKLVPLDLKEYMKD